MPTLKKSFSLIYVLFAIAVLIASFFIYKQPAKFFPPEQNTSYEYEVLHGEIKSLTKEDAKIIPENGEEKGRTITAIINELTNYNEYEIGDDVLIYKQITKESGGITYEISDYYHQSGLLYIFIIFAALTIIIARKKGFVSLVSIVISLGFFYFVFLKMVGAGFSPVLAALTFTLIVTALTIPLIHGFNKKSVSALLSIFIVYIISFFITYLFKEMAGLGSAPGEEFRMLYIIYPNINLFEILIASLFLGAIGALIDTSISIASAIFEATTEHGKMTFQKIYRTGMEVGKDILGSMVNTLLFAYLASSLPFFVLLYLGQTGQSTFSELINMDFISLELTRTFLGAVSLVVMIPIVSAFCAYFITKKSS